MMSGLSTISDAAFYMLLPSYDNVLNELEARKEAWVTVVLNATTKMTQTR